MEVFPTLLQDQDSPWIFSSQLIPLSSLAPDCKLPKSEELGLAPQLSAQCPAPTKGSVNGPVIITVIMIALLLLLSPTLLVPYSMPGTQGLKVFQVNT